MGLIIIIASITGLVIWLRRRKARKMMLAGLSEGTPVRMVAPAGGRLDSKSQETL